MPDLYQIKKVNLINGETLGYREAGSDNRPVMVLLHGNMTSSKHMEILMEQMEGSYKLYAVDMRGFGTSTYNHRIVSLKDLSDDIRFWADALGLKGFVLAGWSTGGGVAMQFAAEHPDYVTKLILIESVGIKGYRLTRKKTINIGNMRKSTQKAVRWSLDKMTKLNVYANRQFVQNLWEKTVYTKNLPPQELYEEYLNDSMTQRNVADLNFALLNFNISNEHNGIADGNGLVNNIMVPTLVLQGDRDLVVPPFVGREIATALWPKALLVILPDCGHSPLIDCMEQLVQNIKTFTNNS